MPGQVDLEAFCTVLDVRERQRELDKEMRAVIVRLQLVSQVAARAYGGGGGMGGHPSSKPPAGEAHPEWERLLADYNVALDDAGRTRVLERAKQALGAWRRSHGAIVAAVNLDTLVVEDGEGYDAEMVAQRYGLTAAHVRRIRQRAGRRPDDGSNPDAKRLPREQRRAEARRMREKGMSTRQIAAVLGVGQSTIVEDLKG